MGGDITVSSEVGVGSEFVLELPARTPTADSSGSLPAAACEPAEEAVGSDTTVLVIDDEPTALELTARVLRREGFEVVCADGGRVGLERARQLRPAAIVLDILMPEVDGWDVLARLKEDPETREIPVVLSSVLEAEKPGIALGAADFIAKPVDSRRLAGSLRRLRVGGDARSALVVEDDAETRGGIRDELGRNGWTAREAINREQALRQIEAEAPAVVIVDLGLTGSGAFTLLEDLARIDPEGAIDVVALAGSELDCEARSRLGSARRLVVGKKDGSSGVGEQIARLVKRYTRDAPPEGDSSDDQAAAD
jgi:CheY-like chemotaxis protein